MCLPDVVLHQKHLVRVHASNLYVVTLWVTFSCSVENLILLENASRVETKQRRGMACIDSQKEKKTERRFGFFQRSSQFDSSPERSVNVGAADRVVSRV